MKLQQYNTLLFTGDSITDADRARPIAEGGIAMMGESYASLFYALMFAWHPELDIHYVNTGISGNTTRDLLGRWETDVMAFKPDWLSILIGANDVWRQFDRPTMPQLHVRPDEYQSNLEQLILRSKEEIDNILLLRPFFIEANTQDPMRQMIDAYGDIVQSLAKKHDVHYIDLQAVFDQVLQHKSHMVLSIDRVHPNKCAHMIIAQAIMDYMEA